MINSYTEVLLSVPDDTVNAVGERPCYGIYAKHDTDAHRIIIDESFESGYSTNVLGEYVSMFGMPLDKVPGLELECHYETTDVDDGFFGCTLTIVDGKCRYVQSYIGYHEQPFSECPIRIG